ncbi:MAG: UDP-N-acetylglucosamine 2-epimerase (non-hydrolyzing) [Oscillospiraceae bacterium]|nr:UDP-N-acetylglucosamine 2-epimerase (non-hydrolyzing) [Oscillospiraceae bacterium]
MLVFGTRPEAIKMAPLYSTLRNTPGVRALCAVTAQHRGMLDDVLDTFGIRPDFDLDIMETNQSLSTITVKSLLGMDNLLSREAPDLILVHGDTSTTFAGALSAFYHKIRVGHVEAGLRTYDKYAPYPEEINRKMTAAIADLHFCPTARNAGNLRREGVSAGIYVTGNTVIDALRMTVKPDYVFRSEPLRALSPFGGRLVLVTAHRRENYGAGLRGIFSALRALCEKYADLRFVYPVHPSPAVREAAYAMLGDIPRIHLIDPLPADDMHNLMAQSYFVLTDSGGLQEEAPALGRPVLVLRRETERPEAVEAGTVRMAGVDKDDIVALASQLLDDAEVYERMAKAVNPYGDGQACARIAQAILFESGLLAQPPSPFGGGPS